MPHLLAVINTGILHLSWQSCNSKEEDALGKLGRDQGLGGRCESGFYQWVMLLFEPNPGYCRKFHFSQCKVETPPVIKNKVRLNGRESSLTRVH